MGEVADIVRGASPRPIQDTKWFDETSEIGWLRISDVTDQNGRIFYLKQKISDEGQQRTRVLIKPHLLLSIAATVGKPVINYVKTGVHDGFLIFMNPRFDVEFMFHWLEMFRPKWQKYGQPGSQVNLNSELVKNQEILLPLLLEQKQIGDLFKRIDDTITLYKRKLESLKELKRGYLQQMFPQAGENVPRVRFAGFNEPWQERTLRDVAEIIGGGTPDTVNPAYWNGNIEWFSPTEIGAETYVSNSQKKITELGLKNSSAKMLTGERTILFTSRAGIGDMAILTRPAATNQGFQSLEIRKTFDVYFIYSMGSKIKKYALKNASGSTFLEISGKNLGKMKLHIPTLKEQTAIGNFFGNFDNQITAQKQKLTQLKQLKIAYMQKMLI